MMAFDSRRWVDPAKQLSQQAQDALTSALRAQRSAGPSPLPVLREAIDLAAREARERAIEPEVLLVQLKRLAEEAGLPAQMGDEESTTVREFVVNACIQAYFD